MTGTTATRRVIRGADRYRWRSEWLDSRQSFPATGNFDLGEHAHGVLMVHNDDRVDAGEGFDSHRHTDAEIITWVLEGAVRHRDSEGNTGVITPGIIQRMTAGRGITHTEANAARRSEDQELRVVQMWVAPEYAGLEPGYAERDFTTELASGALVVVASGMARDSETTAVSIPNPHAALHVARIAAGGRVELPAARFGHLYVARGSVADTDGVDLAEGDAVRTTNSGPFEVTSAGGAEILFWEMHTTFTRSVNA